MEAAPDTLRAAAVTADSPAIVSLPDTAHVSASTRLREAVLQLPGLFLNDNGGYAGITTVSLHGLGSASTNILFDGLKMRNLQSGQSDLGFLDLPTVSEAVVDYAQNTLSFRTRRPVFGSSPVAGDIRMAGESFGTYRPSAVLDIRLGSGAALSLNASMLRSRGDFPYGDGMRRQGNDITRYSGGFDLFAGNWHLKALASSSDRGAPGSTVWPSEDRQEDRNMLLQGTFAKALGPRWTLVLAAKASRDVILYHSAWEDSEYAQNSLQFNSVQKYSLTRAWTVSLEAGVDADDLASTAYDAFRFTGHATLGSSLVLGRLVVDAALEYVGESDRGGLSRNSLSPSVQLKLDIAEGLSFRSFARRARRLPTFNELYYVGYGNPALKAEDAFLSDAGIGWHRAEGSRWRTEIRLDGFYNAMRDKIASAPSPENPNFWYPYNVASVRTTGLDGLASVRYAPDKRTVLNARIRYSLQDAFDTSGGGAARLPYIARHSVVADLSAERGPWMLSAVWNLRAGRSDASGIMPDWNTLDLSLTRRIGLYGPDSAVIAGIGARNLNGCRYEISSGYPMPGRSFNAFIEIKF